MVLNDAYLRSAVPVPAGGSVGLRAALTNDAPQPDRLVAVTTPAAASVELLHPDGAVATGGIEVPGGGQVNARTGPVLIRLTGLTAGLRPEALVPITFEFANAGSVTVDDVPVATPSQ
jgi:copper(I)-binding protein